MSTVLHPVGPQRARVYWVRRLLVVLVLAAVVVLATSAVSWLRGADGDTASAAGAQGSAGQRGDAAPVDEGAPVQDEGSGGTTSADEGDSAAGADDDESDEPAASTPVDCEPEALRLTLTGAEVKFDAGTNPVLTATVTNVGDVACTVDAGDATREVLVTSGEDRVWSTKDCATEETASRQLLLGAGAADAVPIEWTRVRSAEGCPSGLPAPKAGTYQAVATLGGLSSQTVVFILE